jgi:glutamate formiminotransferase/formiminotetrahydrofolate cyclodeaminase
MTARLVECIPNFSEARRPDVVEAILEAARSVAGIRILDRHSDMDHNRTVLTFIGTPEAVEEAAYQTIAKAGQLIDLEHHQGEHPRIGATDVVPFVPISGVSMAECVEIARRLGKRVAETLGIPVYLYEEAATCPEHKNLEDIRRGQYEMLKEVIASDPGRKPDFGPSQLSGAGATVIGARNPLIAYNIYLTTDDVSIADKIARRVRNSSGGFHFVKGMGVLVEGCAQVSMNLTNFKRSPMAQITEMIRREAQRYGVSIHHSEVVGLIPNAALIDASKWYMQMDQFEPEQVLETQLFEDIGDQNAIGVSKESSLVDSIAAGTPTPGGGSASAHTASVAAALIAMVGRLTVGKPKYMPVEDQIWPMIDKAEALRKRLEAGVQKDSDAYVGFMQARRLPKDSEAQQAERLEAMHKATLHAAGVPLETAADALDVLKMAAQIAEIGNVNAISDAGAAGNLAYAAVKGAALNVRINLFGMEGDTDAKRMLNQIRSIEDEAVKLIDTLETILRTRGNLAF